MNLKVEWANNPTTFAEVEDWNAVTLKHLNPKKRKDLQHIIDSVFIDLPCAVTSEDKIEKALCNGAEYTFAMQLTEDGKNYVVFLIQSNQFGTRVIRIADFIIKI